jgi:predicted hydrocarbon binding protein
MLNTFFDKFIFTNNIKYTHSNFFLMNIPFVVAPLESLIGIVSVNEVDFHKKLYSAVKSSTKESLFKDLSLNFSDKKKELEFVENFFTASGWGSIQSIDVQYEGKKAIVVVENSPFASALKGKVTFPVDSLLRGTLAGIFSKLFEEDIDCVESECAALASERCKFILKSKTEFDFANTIVQQQLTHE